MCAKSSFEHSKSHLHLMYTSIVYLSKFECYCLWADAASLEELRHALHWKISSCLFLSLGPTEFKMALLTSRSH